MSSETSNEEEKERPNIHLRGDRGFAPLPEEGGAYVAPQDNSRGPFILTLAIVVLIVFGVVVFNAYRQGVRVSNQDVLPQIASEGRFKSRPEDPGGRSDEFVDMEVMHQGGEGANDEDYQAARVREEPVPFDDPIESAVFGDNAGLQSKTPPVPQPSQKAPRIVGQSGQPLDLQTQSSVPPPSFQQPSPSPSRRQYAEAPRPAEQQPSVSIARPTPDARAPQPRPTPTPRPARTSNAVQQVDSSGPSPFLVQLASVQDRTRTDGEWSKAAERAPDLFLYAQSYIQTVDLDDKGIWHRIMVSGFNSRGEANAFCDEYKTRGGDCLVKANG